MASIIPKESGSPVVWPFYTLQLNQGIRGRWRESTFAVLSIVGPPLIVISFLGNLFFGGVHAYIQESAIAVFVSRRS